MNVFQFNHSNFDVYFKQLVPRKYKETVNIMAWRDVTGYSYIQMLRLGKHRHDVT